MNKGINLILNDMEKEIIERWENGKGNLRKYFETHDIEEYNEYPKVVKALICRCLNYGYDEYSSERISEEFDVSDYGHYQGTQIFLLHKDAYQPDLGEYYVFDNYYGSCSGCDTLLSIVEFMTGLPDKEEVDRLMTLCLHMVQRMKCLANLWED